MREDTETVRLARASVLDQRALRLQAHHDLRCWMQKYPELFSTKARVDSFIAIGLLTTQSDLIPSLSSLYRRLAYAENSVRSYVRALANGGWVSFVRAPSGDKRSIGLRLEAPIIRAYEEYSAFSRPLPCSRPPCPCPTCWRTRMQLSATQR